MQQYTGIATETEAETETRVSFHPSPSHNNTTHNLSGHAPNHSRHLQTPPPRPLPHSSARTQRTTRPRQRRARKIKIVQSRAQASEAQRPAAAESTAREHTTDHNIKGRTDIEAKEGGRASIERGWGAGAAHGARAATCGAGRTLLSIFIKKERKEFPPLGTFGRREGRTRARQSPTARAAGWQRET